MRMSNLTAFDIAVQYAAAIAAHDEERMHAMRARIYMLDAVYLDAYGGAPLAEHEGKDMYHALFSAFPDCDLAVTRTIAGAEVVVQEWTFTGTHTGQAESWSLFGRLHEKPTGRAVRLRGVSSMTLATG